MGMSDSTSSRYRKDINTTSHYKSTNPIERHENFTDRQNTSQIIKKSHHKTSQIVKLGQNTSQNVTKTNLN